MKKIEFIAIANDNSKYKFLAFNTEDAIDWVIAHLDCSKAWQIQTVKSYNEKNRIY